jgi:predicted ATPase
LPDSEDRARLELALLITLGVPLIALEGYASPDVGQVYRRARELCHRLGDTLQIPQALWGLWSFYLVRAELGTTRDIAEEFLHLNTRLPYGEIAMEITLMHLGEFSSALRHSENAVELYDSKKHRNDASRYSQNPLVGAKSHGAWTLWFLGEPDRALAKLEEILAFARDLSDPHGLAHTLFFSATLHQLRREPHEAQQSAEAAVAIAGEHGILLYETMSRILLGWALVENGQMEKGIAEIRDGFVAHQPTGMELLRPQFLALLAEALARADQTEEALRFIEEALAHSNRNKERYYLAELYRLKGEMLLEQLARRPVSRGATNGKTAASSAVDRDAERCISLAVDIAREQGAKSLELRASVSLARVYQAQRKLKEGRNLLADVYSKFTEGFATRDLKDAKALLETLR